MTPPDATKRGPGAAPARATRLDVVATLAIVGALLAWVVGRVVVRRLGPHPSADECAALLDRYADHLAHAVDPKPSASAVADQKAAARARAGEQHAMARCATELTRAEADCAMQAHSADEFERCIE